MTINHLFPLRIRPDIKRKTTQVVHEAQNEDSGSAFKTEIKEADVPCFKEEKGSNKEIQVAFRSKAQDKS